MDGYQFTTAIVNAIVSLAWPAAFIAAVWMFREKLNALLPLLRLKYKEFDVSFRLGEAEKEAQALPAPEEPSEPTPEEADRFAQLLRISPRAAIMDRRLELEEALQNFARSIGVKTPRGGLLQLTRDLRKNELIDHATSALLDDLRSIGNVAAHDTLAEITAVDATRFGALADKLIQQLQISAAAAELNQRPTPLNQAAGHSG